jgi:toxin-antitoxin system PIN domain toxin
MSVSLLDVNVLVALFDPDHVHHELAHDWFAGHRAAGWATCPTTENGFLRVLTSAAYPAGANRPEGIVSRLRLFQQSGQHVFWPDAVSITDLSVFRPSYMRGQRQVTDVYLLGIAVRMNGRLATFDKTIPVSAVHGATRESIAVIGG